MKLFMLLLGCKPNGRNTEQHDVFFGIAAELAHLIPALQSFWPDAGKSLHIDAWREVNVLNGYRVLVKNRPEADKIESAEPPAKLFFINLGGYKQHEFEEFHYKMIVAAFDKAEAIKSAKQTAFYKHTGIKGAPSHIDDKYGIDVDDVYAIEDILQAADKTKYSIELIKEDAESEDEIYLGYFLLTKAKFKI